MPSNPKKARNKKTKRNRINKKRKKGTLKFIQSGGMTGDDDLQQALNAIIIAAEKKKTMSATFIDGVGNAARALSTTVNDVTEKWTVLQKQLADAKQKADANSPGVNPNANDNISVIENYNAASNASPEVIAAVDGVKAQVGEVYELKTQVDELRKIINDMGEGLDTGNTSITALQESTNQLKQLVEGGSASSAGAGAGGLWASVVGQVSDVGTDVAKTASRASSTISTSASDDGVNPIAGATPEPVESGAGGWLSGLMGKKPTPTTPTPTPIPIIKTESGEAESGDIELVGAPTPVPSLPSAEQHLRQSNALWKKEEAAKRAARTELPPDTTNPLMNPLYSNATHSNGDSITDRKVGREGFLSDEELQNKNLLAARPQGKSDQGGGYKHTKSHKKKPKKKTKKNKIK